jgi:hypothetical protein
MSEGMHAPKTFKSMIDPDLIPLICAECDLQEEKWEVLDDITLLSAIEDRLKPHDAMDFTVQLKRITFEKDESKGSLTQRYRMFAEPFLAKVSEAKAAGCQLTENVIKLTFSRAVSTSAILQGWLEQSKWVSAAETHRRITNNLKMVDAYEALSGTPAGTQRQAQHQPQQQHQVQQQAGQGIQQQPAIPGQQPAQQHQPRGARFNAQIAAAIHNAMIQYQAQPQHQAGQHANYNAAPAIPAANINLAQQARPALALPAFPGLDGRGPSWHVHSQLLECRNFPCHSKFCQACAVHGHTVDDCRKRAFNNPGINTSGYWSEVRAGHAPLKQPKPANTINVATQAQPSFPTPYQMNQGAASQHSPQTHDATQNTPTVNNTAQRTATNPSNASGAGAGQQ